MVFSRNPLKNLTKAEVIAIARAAEREGNRRKTMKYKARAFGKAMKKSTSETKKKTSSRKRKKK